MSYRRALGQGPEHGTRTATEVTMLADMCPPGTIRDLSIPGVHACTPYTPTVSWIQWLQDSAWGLPVPRWAALGGGVLVGSWVLGGRRRR